ncbi:MAG: hypothetical protein SO287_03250 [Parabacteroides sp.]|nr:hypothetical protein [Parabacteroides sp.]
MSKINKQKNTVSKKKVQEPIGTRIAKAVFEEKKISERIFGYISYDISFVKATYTGKTQRPAKITSLEKGIVGILLVDETASFEKIGLILGLDVVNDKAEQLILRTAIETLRGFNAIEGDDSCLALTDAGRTYADKGERPDTYTKSFDIYVDKNHLSWLNIKNCIGDNLSKINEINTPCENLNLSLEEIKQFAECQAQDVHFPQNRYLLESAIWREGHEASYKVYVCFVQSIASSEDVRAFVYEENSNALNPIMSEQINSNPDLLAELLENCIKFECEIDEETIVLEGDDVETAKSEISEEIKEAEKQLVLEEEKAQNAPLSVKQDVSSPSTNLTTDKERLHKKALYDSLSFELELQKIFNEDDPDEIWLISPWIRKGAFMHDRGPLIESFLKDENKRVFIAYSEPALNNDGKPMMDEEVEPGIIQLDEQYPNFFYVQLPEFHLKNVIEVKGDQKVLFSGSFNVLSFSVSEQQKHVRREEMTLAHHTVAKNKYADFQLEFAEIYASRIMKEIESLDTASLNNYKNERLDYFLGIDNQEIHKLFSPIEDLIEEKTLGCIKENLYKQLTKIGQELVAASNMGGLNAKDKKKYKSALESISKELTTNAIDDPSTLELLNNNQILLDVIPDKIIFPGKTQRNTGTSYQPKAPKSVPAPSVSENVSISEIKGLVSDAMNGTQGARLTMETVSIAKKMCSPTNLSLENADKLFKVLAGANVLACAIKFHIEKKMGLADVHNSLRRVIKKCEDFDNLSIIYNEPQKRIIFDFEGVQFQFEKFDVNGELMEIINAHENRVTRWDGSKTFMYSSEILDIATKYEIE